jgi:hypothetical protein
MLKNNYGSIILYKSVKYLSANQKYERSQNLLGKVNVTATKEKAKLYEFIDSLYPI